MLILEAETEPTNSSNGDDDRTSTVVETSIIDQSTSRTCCAACVHTSTPPRPALVDRGSSKPAAERSSPAGTAGLGGGSGRRSETADGCGLAARRTRQPLDASGSRAAAIPVWNSVDEVTVAFTIIIISAVQCTTCSEWVPARHFKVETYKRLECGPMPNVMAALPNIGGALCSTPQRFADAHY